jgi:hypothetical protein
VCVCVCVANFGKEWRELACLAPAAGLLLLVIKSLSRKLSQLNVLCRAGQVATTGNQSLKEPSLGICKV